jgi:hypothetical protein
MYLVIPEPRRCGVREEKSRQALRLEEPRRCGVREENVEGHKTRNRRRPQVFDRAVRLFDIENPVNAR